MASDQPSWKDIVATVERVNLQQTLSIKLRERLINRKYIEDANQQIECKRQLASRKKVEEGEQRSRLEQEAYQQAQTRRKLKEARLIREKQYCSNNINLLKIRESNTKDSCPVQQHPFIRLVDEQDRRLVNFRSNLRRQNEINSMQQKIKANQNHKAKERELENSKKYTNHINDYYDKKIKDRQQFRNKYLRLANNSNTQLEKSPQNLQRQYSSINESLMNSKREQIKLRSRYLDSKLSKINKQVDTSDSSPAYLGRIPISSDRQQQLKYLEKSIFKASEFEPHINRIRTEGDSPVKDQNRRRFTTQMNQMVNLERYFERSSHRAVNKCIDQNESSSKLHSIESKPCSLPNVHNSPSINHNTEQLLNQGAVYMQDRPQKYEIRQENSYQKRNRRVLSTYDIISNKKKLIVI